MRKITVQYGQSIYDIAVQCYGSVTGVFSLIADNALPDGLATVLTPGQVLFIKSAAADVATLAAVTAANIQPKSNTDESYLLTMDGDLLTFEDGGYRVITA